MSTSWLASAMTSRVPAKMFGPSIRTDMNRLHVERMRANGTVESPWTAALASMSLNASPATEERSARSLRAHTCADNGSGAATIPVRNPETRRDFMVVPLRFGDHHVRNGGIVYGTLPRKSQKRMLVNSSSRMDCVARPAPESVYECEDPESAPNRSRRGFI